MPTSLMIDDLYSIMTIIMTQPNQP